MINHVASWHGHVQRNAAVLARLRSKPPNKVALDANREIARERLLARAMLGRFESSGSSGGHPWKPLKISTIRDKAREGYGGAPILVRTGRLRRAATMGVDVADPGGVSHRFVEGSAGRTRLSVVAKALDRDRRFLQDVVGPEARTIVGAFLNKIRKWYSRILDGRRAQ